MGGRPTPVGAGNGRNIFARPDDQGSAGLIPNGWDAAHDQWGANQLQNRFMQMFSRRMTALDGQAWAAARMIGEAVSRIGSVNPTAVLEYLKGPDFALAAFKGQKLTLRDWNLQLRQPILLADARYRETRSWRQSRRRVGDWYHKR